MDPKSSYYNSIFWIEVDRIKPNPFQPRKEFDEAALKSLSESIRQYGVLQPLTVTKKEIEKPGEGIVVEYELIAGERRLRASKLAGVIQVPCLIRSTEDSDMMKLEMAIIENLQREDLNPVDRAKAFSQLIDAFKLTHADVGRKIGKSREYVSNSVRILNLPQDMQDALSKGEIVEGHTRPLLMLIDRPDEQKTLFQEITTKRLNVRDSEQIARRIAMERTRKNDLTPELVLLERELSEKFGTRVRIEKGGTGGKVLIEFFSAEDLSHIRDVISKSDAVLPSATQEPLPADATTEMKPQGEAHAGVSEAPEAVPTTPSAPAAPNGVPLPPIGPDHELPAPPLPPQLPAEEQDLYSVKNFTV
jgi:ParB family chromosome partitioning protein